MNELYRALPKVDTLLADPRLTGLPRTPLLAIARDVLASLRQGISIGEVTEIGDVGALVEAGVHELLGGRMVPVINATGIVVHTNLGRAPWPAEAIEAARRAAGYTNLEMSLATGHRGGRLDGVRRLLRHLTGAQDALVVNNCAAAVLLCLTALAKDREVIVSRGELVEIGGSFRVPDVISAGGAQLVAVGTTNRTHIGDFRHAITERTSVLLKVHPANFRVVGFTAAPSREALCELASDRGLVALEDLGSGSLTGRPGEPSVRGVVDAGLDLVTFSGDKLLGGPQAGLIVGRADLIATLRNHALYRALRIDKVSLAAVEATLALHAAERPTPTDVMLDASVDTLRTRAEHLRARLATAGVEATVHEDVGFTGGGALPGTELPTWTVRVEVPSLDSVAMRLRAGSPAVVPRIAHDRLILDVRTVPDAEITDLAARVASAIHVG